VAGASAPPRRGSAGQRGARLYFAVTLDPGDAPDRVRYPQAVGLSAEPAGLLGGATARMNGRTDG